MRTFTGCAQRAQISPGRCAKCWCTSAALTLGHLGDRMRPGRPPTGDFHPMSSRPCRVHTLRSRGRATAAASGLHFILGLTRPASARGLTSFVRRLTFHAAPNAATNSRRIARRGANIQARHLAMLTTEYRFAGVRGCLDAKLVNNIKNMPIGTLSQSYASQLLEDTI